MARPAVFLDRDGTMIEDVGYLARLQDVRWFSYTVDAIRLLNRAGFIVCVTTNQAGIGRGYYTEETLHTIHEAMAAHLSEGGARVDGWFYCPHHPHADLPAYRSVCACRKPEPGMIGQARERFDIDPTQSFVIGDKMADVGAAVRAGMRGILVRTGYGEEIWASHDGQVPGAAHVAADLMAATSWVMGAGRASRSTP